MRLVRKDCVLGELSPADDSRKASTASRGVLPGKGDQHSDSGDRGIITVFVVACIPLGQELITRDPEDFPRGAVEESAALFRGSFHDLHRI